MGCPIDLVVLVALVALVAAVVARAAPILIVLINIKSKSNLLLVAVVRRTWTRTKVEADGRVYSLLAELIYTNTIVHRYKDI